MTVLTSFSETNRSNRHFAPAFIHRIRQIITRKMSYGPAGMETFDDYDYIVYNYESDEDGFFFGDSQPRGNNNAFNSHQNTNIASCTSVNGDFSSAGVKTNSVTNQNQSFGKQESVGFGTGRGRGMIAAQCAQTVGQNEKRTGGFPSAPSSSSSKGKKRFVVVYELFIKIKEITTLNV